MSLYYIQHKDAALKLIASQITDGWSLEQIKAYWYALGYDMFFIKSVVEPFFINPSSLSS